ncbi:MFS transporter [Streptomyces spiramenti]|uniref:MFS transporter n=1 Tax=Streptomyces spiramenti TaxID=2720606 RepID=A0ABX1AQW3_9ACTN|nr:MFS transporter [Streptomyces spiramenti]NJP66842.1 MFS transporter [Streptomyces spiramenti]
MSAAHRPGSDIVTGTPSPAPVPPPTTGRPGWTLAVTGAATFMAALDNLVVTTALPVIRDDLGGSLADLGWIVNAYTLPFACLLLLAAALGDRYGRRRVFTVGVVVFTAASAWAALAGGTGSLVAARALQGVGAAVLLPLSLTLISAAVPAARRGAAFGIWGAVNGVAVAGGPLVGGVVTEHLSWQWIFWLNVPVGLLLLPLIRVGLAESHGRRRRLDLGGAALAGAGLFGAVLGIVRGHEHGWSTPGSWAALAVGAALLAAFVRCETRVPEPMLPMRFFRSRTFSALNGAGLLMFLGMFGSIFLLAQFFQIVQGYSPTEAGLRVLPWTAMPIVVAPLAGVLTDRVGGRPVIGGGMLLMAAGLALFALVAAPDAPYAALVPALALCGLGMALFFAPTGAMVMGSVPVADQGIASGVNNSLREVGGALGIALLASVFAARGGYADGREFVDGLVPALWLAVAALLLAAALVLALVERGPAAAEGPAVGPHHPAGPGARPGGGITGTGVRAAGHGPSAPTRR